MIYTDIYKEEIEKARVHAACINETAMAFARMLDKCVTFAQNEFDCTVYPENVLGYEEPVGMSIAFGKTAELGGAIAESYHKDESLVTISIGRYWGMDHSESKIDFIDFEDERGKRRSEKYDIAFQINVFVAKSLNDTDDPDEVRVKYPSVSTMVVFMKKYPDEILESNENQSKHINERYQNDYDCYEIIRDDDSEPVLRYVPAENLYGGYDDVPEQYRETYEEIMGVINDYLKDNIG